MERRLNRRLQNCPLKGRASCSGGEYAKDAPSLRQSTLMTYSLTTVILVSVKYFFQINPIQRACWVCEQSFHMVGEPDDWQAKSV